MATRFWTQYVQWIWTYLCVINLCHYWFRQWLVACSAPSHYLNQWCIIFIWTFRNKHQSNCIRNSKFSFMKMHLKMSSGEWRPFCLDLNVLTRLVSSWPLMELLTSFKFLCIRLWTEAEIVITANGPTVGITATRISTHWGLDTMVDILKTTFQIHLLEWEIIHFIPIYRHFYQGSNYLHSGLGQIKAWHRTDDKPLSKPMMA